MDAMERDDVDAVVAMLAEDAAWSMPPLAAWFTGTDGLRGFLSEGPLSGRWRWAHRPAFASGQPAVGSYTWYEPEGCYLAFALDVLTLDATRRIREVTSFIVRRTDVGREAILRWPDAPPDEAKVAAAFEAFGLPARLDAADR